MRVIVLIAMREYADNVKTKGFWLGVLLIPVMFIAIFLFSNQLASSTPTRHFILIDQSGLYTAAVESALEREHQRRVIQEFSRYLLSHRRDSATAGRSVGPGQLGQLIIDAEMDEPSALDEWQRLGGLHQALTLATPYLRDDAPPFEPPAPQYVAAPPPSEVDTDAPPEHIVDQLRPYLLGERRLAFNGQRLSLFALILIPEDVDEAILHPDNGQQPAAAASAVRGVQYWTGNPGAARLPEAIQSSINHQVRERAFQERGINVEMVRDIQALRLPVSRLDPGREAGQEEIGVLDTFRQWAPMGFVYLLFISLMQSVQYLLSNTIEEKSNRIIEVLIASVTPAELMMGKLLGIGLSGITTITAWLGSFFLFITLYQSLETTLIAQMLGILFNSELIPYFIFYYLAGYALYAGLFLAIGSLCNTLKEAQSLMAPLMLVLLLPIFTIGLVAQDPNGTLARIMSWIPLFTPFTMMNRAAAQPPLIDLAGTTVLLLLSVALVLWLSGKVFRQGVLRSGQPPRLLELWRMIRR